MPEFSKRMEGREQLEKMEILRELDRALYELIEMSIEWDPQKRAQLKQKIQELLLALGVKNLEEAFSLQTDLFKSLTKIPTPDDYPSKEEFSINLQKIEREEKKNMKTPPYISVGGVAENAQCDWSKVGGRGQDRLKYLFNLGKLISSEFHYKNMFEGDDIDIKENWEVENGRHRALVLKILGLDYVGSMNWVKVNNVERNKN